MATTSRKSTGEQRFMNFMESKTTIGQCSWYRDDDDTYTLRVSGDEWKVGRLRKIVISSKKAE